LHRNKQTSQPALIPPEREFADFSASLGSTASSTMTIQVCAQYCLGLGHKMFGLEYSQECFCGDNRQAGSVAAPETECSMACAGNAAEKCGGPSRLNIYLWP
jgi:hypothetical protein